MGGHLKKLILFQVEPIRVMTTSPSSILGGADSWASDDSSTAHGGLLTIKAEVDSWTRQSGGPVSSDLVQTSGSNRRSLRHAASHPSSREEGSSPGSPSALSKKRLDWRNSHRNYRSAPTTAASRDSYALHYETRRALRDYHPHSIEASSAYQTALSSRRMLPKRGGSMRETMATSQDVSTVSEELSGPGSCIPGTTVAQQRCQMMASPATKRWRCHTVDCPCSNNVTAINKDRMLDCPLAVHRHSFPSSDELASPSTSHRRHYQRNDDLRSHFGYIFLKFNFSTEIVIFDRINCNSI